ncbi:hypothetical protein OG896_07360 [Streptomyces sp. NBC_00669]|uniref:hypothetical protein n=1 Tax=unclassified Streptomyces TaxID=2593676 RepID=UPI002E2F2D67|nr:hypothetical protein [Streptomyces sp. NBC_00669]
MRTSLPPAPEPPQAGHRTRRRTLGTLDQAYVPPALRQVSLRRRPVGERTAS